LWGQLSFIQIIASKTGQQFNTANPDINIWTKRSSKSKFLSLMTVT
jgi:hypothetical protein